MSIVTIHLQNNVKPEMQTTEVRWSYISISKYYNSWSDISRYEKRNKDKGFHNAWLRILNET